MEHSVIRNLIMDGAFSLYGQPKWTFGKNTCNTYEVFAEKVRMPGGEETYAWPIVELIEKDERLTELYSSWFMESAMGSAMKLSDETAAHLTLSMNLLPSYANHSDFVERVMSLLQKTGLPPQKLQFELSEAQRLTEQGVQNLNRLHDDHGVALLLANFGTGYSNIDLLSDVHFDGLELDRSFAARIPESEQACRVIVAVVHMAHTLDMYVCAKGIENQEQFEFFEEIDCRKGQGYMIGKPMPMEELRQYICNYAKKHI
ncbi:MAG: EAL domain-containing protein [Eubacteriales bacterium]|nr:EAL domain-containing protein [Eubacteriales bacterium]